MAESTKLIMYLIDTNIWLERLLNQERAEEVAQFLTRIPTERFMITDFTFHSIGVILTRHEEHETLLHFTQDVLVDGAVRLVSLDAIDMAHLVDIMTQFRLDFDDAYQYVAAEKYGAELISFDKDFDRTELGRKTPINVLSTRDSVLMA